MPNGIAVTRMTPRYLNPSKVKSNAGIGTEKPKLDTDAPSFARLRSP